ncbi:MAG: 3-hydroxyacyl-CoA dehydrogenase [Frankiales bacterium]|nr:3-hydroxyacyl-CoA dehydrogenase [Frankiales bacterium]
MTALTTEPLAAAERPALRLVAAPASAPPYDDEPGDAPLLRLVAPLTVVPDPVLLDDDAWLAAERTPSTQLPAVQAFARVLVQGVLEVLAGVRPLKQLQRDTTPELYASLAGSLAGRPRATGARPNRRAVRTLHVQERPEGIAEVCATVQRGARTVALALRLEGLDGRWKCTELVGI